MSQRFKGFSGKAARRILALVSAVLLVAAGFLVVKGVAAMQGGQDGLTVAVFLLAGGIVLVFSLYVLALALSNLFDACACGHWRWGHAAISHATGPPPRIIRYGVCGKAVCDCLDFQGVPRGV